MAKATFSCKTKIALNSALFLISPVRLSFRKWPMTAGVVVHAWCATSMRAARSVAAGMPSARKRSSSNSSGVPVLGQRRTRLAIASSKRVSPGCSTGRGRPLGVPASRGGSGRARARSMSWVAVGRPRALKAASSATKRAVAGQALTTSRMPWSKAVEAGGRVRT